MNSDLLCHWGLRIQICPSIPHTGLKSLLKILLISCLWRSFSFPASHPGRRAALYWYVFSPMKCSSLELSLFRDSLKCHFFAEFRKTDFVPCFVLFVMVRAMLSHDFLLHNWRWIHHTVHLLWNRGKQQGSLSCVKCSNSSSLYSLPLAEFLIKFFFFNISVFSNVKGE